MNSKPYVSRYLRKQNYQSLNYPSPTPSPPAFSPHHAPVHELSGQKRTSLQQRQIEQLEQKVDLILQHNQKLTLTNHLLQAENEELKHRQLDEFAQRQRLSRYQIEDNETLRRVRSELQMKTKELELLGRDYEAAKEAGRREAEGLRVVISNLNTSLDEAKIDSLRLQQELSGLREQAETDRRMAVKEAERRVQEEWSRSQRERAEQAAREQAQQRRIIQELTQKFQEERAEWQSRKNALVAKLQDNHNREIAELREEMASQFQIELTKLAEEAAERCRNQREKAEQFVRDSLEGNDTAGQLEAETLRNQIAGLQSSLDHRRKLISELAANELQRESGRDGLAETLLVRRRLKEQVESLLREIQTLKIKTAQKHDRDLRQMVRVYQDRIDVLSKQSDYLTDQNARLRSNYQAQIANKVAMRRAWQVQAGQLRNLVRKLKVQLRGIEEEFKLNIEGIKDQNLTFSMSLMKSMVQDRDKANFFEDENRKLRALYTRHEADLEQERKQAQEKVAFFQAKYDHLKGSLEAEKTDLAQKEQLIQEKLEARQRAISEANRAQREHLAQVMEEWQGQKEQLEKQLQAATERAESAEAEAKELKQQAELLRSKLKENGEHIQRLRMQLQMAGVDDHEKQDVVNHWKEHYQGIILKLQGDKRELKTVIDTANGKIQQLVYRYRTLENELQKATATLQRRGEVDQRVIELGLDRNLVKNMAEIWSRPTL